MEDTAKVTAKLAALQSETGKVWLAVINTNHLFNIITRSVTDIKTFVSVNGEVRDFPVSDYTK